MSEPTLDNCENEPIHIPGSIQSHGFLIAVDEAFTIRYCSENIRFFLDISAPDLLGKKLSEIDIFDQKSNEQLFSLINLADNQNGSGQQHFRQTFNDRHFNVVVNFHHKHYTFDFEPADGGLEQDIQTLIGRSLSEILSDSNLNRLLNNAASQIKKIIEYDRVMVYKFHDDGHGEVVAEAKIDEIESWMGLHYPASDIPKQARELYKINLVRLIADVHSTPA
ncbi:MAG: histidine kinase, partial [Pedobacter sp.]|nr:histidine kinase [Pedobacter sp.]